MNEMISAAELDQTDQWTAALQQAQQLILSGYHEQAKKILHQLEHVWNFEYQDIVYSDLGYCYFYNKDFLKSDFYFEKAFSLDPKKKKTITGWAATLIQNKKLKKALNLLDLLRSPDDQDLNVFLIKIECAIQMKNLSLAHALLNEIEHQKKFSLSNKEYLEVKANVLFFDRKHNELFDFLFKNFDLNPSFNFYYQLAFLFFVQLKFKDAWVFYMKNVYLKAKKENNFNLDFEMDLKEKKISIYNGQGVGDQVFFLSVIPDLVPQYEKVDVYCDERLLTLFERSFSEFDNLSFFSQKKTKGPCVPIEQLTANRIQSFQDIRSRSYLHADPKDKNFFKARYAQQFGDKLKVGISWASGNPSSYFLRSIPLEKWRVILGDWHCTQHCAFINLQYGHVEEELKWIGDPDFNLYVDPLVDPLKNLDQFCAQLDALDLIVSVDNSTVHFAGALGKKVWCLLSDPADWRWLKGFEFAKWYPDVKLYTQTKTFFWDDVLEKVKQDLSHFVEEKIEEIP